jgi:hypothetical protein
MTEPNPHPNSDETPQSPVGQSLDASAILAAEFEYIAQSAFQANEDRARVTNFYIVSVGSLIAAILSSHVDSSSSTQIPVYWAFTALFVILSLTGLTTIIQLAQLRIAWFHSIAAMNHIKEYAAGHAAGADLGSAFLWTAKTQPPLFKARSVSFLLALQVALLGGCTVAAAILSAGMNLGRWNWGWAVGCGLLFSLGQLLWYWLLLKRERGRL